MKPRNPIGRPLAKLKAITFGAILCAGMTHPPQAWALMLGGASVHSVMGEPLSAEIDVPSISDEEAASLRVGLASLNAMRAAGFELHPALERLQIQLDRRPGERTVLRVTSPATVDAPSLNLIVEVTWSRGRLLRDYTLLLKPAPGTEAVSSPILARTSGNPSSEALVLQHSNTQGMVTVRPGDTAGAIASAHKPPDVSLNQFLLAMQRQNPEAFIAGNVNRLKAGVVLNIPNPALAGSISSAEARQIISAQHREFHALRHRLAAKVPKAKPQETDRQATGYVKGDARTPSMNTSPIDRLTLSKQGVSGAQEDQVAGKLRAQAAAARVAELSRNIAGLSSLSTPDDAGQKASASPSTPPPAGMSGQPSDPSWEAPVTVLHATPAEDRSRFGSLQSHTKALLAFAFGVILIAAITFQRRRRHRGAEAPSQPAG